jgi:hypothetical protein
MFANTKALTLAGLEKKERSEEISQVVHVRIEK